MQGNRAGTNADGTAAVPNGIETPPSGVTDPQGSLGTGIRLRNGSVGNTIGGVTDAGSPAVGNLVSGNIADGIGLSGASTSANLIIGNRVGTGPAGTVALANELNGVLLDGATGNTVGGAAAGRRNLISGNRSDGVQISGGASGNVVLGNFVGVDVGGTLAIGNGDNGVFVDGSTGNTVGGLDPLGGLLTAGNVISGNFDGVRVRGPGASGNLIVGNFIGTDATGTIDLGNRDDGVQLVSSDHNTVGGTATGAANLIASNTANGVVINNAGASANLVVGNLIGTDIAGTAGRGNGGAGVLIATSAVGNTIGGLGGRRQPDLAERRRRGPAPRAGGLRATSSSATRSAPTAPGPRPWPTRSPASSSTAPPATRSARRTPPRGPSAAATSSRGTTGRASASSAPGPRPTRSSATSSARTATAPRPWATAAPASSSTAPPATRSAGPPPAWRTSSPATSATASTWPRAPRGT